MTWFNDDLDRIDASVFSGDVLESEDNRKELEAMCNRWRRALAEREMQLAIAPDCPHCNQPVLYEHVPTAVMVDTVDNGFKMRSGPYHAECGKILTLRTVAATPAQSGQLP